VRQLKLNLCKNVQRLTLFNFVPTIKFKTCSLASGKKTIANCKQSDGDAASVCFWGEIERRV